ncbi:MAG: hypothetical protein ACI3X4_07350 [Bacteroidaceae bacterium]
MKTRNWLRLATLLLIVLTGGEWQAAQARPENGLADVSKIDTLWPQRVWSIPWMDKSRSFPCEMFEAPEFFRTCIIKGFAVDDRERFYIMGGEPNASIACYEGERQVWKRLMPFSLKRSVYGLMQVKGDSIYFFDEERFRLRRMHRDGHGKINYTDLRMPPEDSVVWACIYADRFRLQLIDKHDVKYYQGEFTVRTHIIDVYLNRCVEKSSEQVATIGFYERLRMYGGGKDVEVDRGFNNDYLPLFVKTPAGDTLREVRFYGYEGAAAVTSISVPLTTVLEASSMNARRGDYLYVPSYTKYDSHDFFISKYNARPLWHWMKEAAQQKTSGNSDGTTR